MAFETISENIKGVSTKTQDYIESMAEYYKLLLFKSTMKGAISLVNLLIFGSIFLFVLLFISIAAAFLIGNELGKVSYGFFIVGAFYGIILLLLFIFGRPLIEKNLLIKFSKLLYDENDLTPKEAAEEELNSYSETLTNEKKLS
ncbi:hypothetical protein [Cochleicola gelatinilyticus]|uniref:Competence protein n=1 Tax=Cochleicola gelatinilyticus TaxID=1763537 RepID=A0A167J1S4_9FLAO|nr:hypothetical protein [Cochleicola gelatinilyticus]OAB80246.1 hypothetical protein ULVI_05785 [Cochleicola gelatinilyticus]